MSLRASSGRAITPKRAAAAGKGGDKRRDLIEDWWTTLKEDSWGADGESQTHGHVNP